ncbi:RNA-directed DNA polymerase, eukaryota, reverse transcriptase zinc-binding domain protein [Tanacetum coccineum]
MEEIRSAVWDCGSQKALGPDGFTFKFVKHFWDDIKLDIQSFMVKFFKSSKLPQGTNSAFITLIPKIPNPLLIRDYRPISLIGIQYNIIAKILANRLSKVIDSLVSQEQSAFISGRQILDGPLILSEIIDWYKIQKKKMLLFKVDFENAFDSVSWRYLYHVMCMMGFGFKWRNGIKSCLYYARASILINGSPALEFSLKRGLRQGDPLSPFLFIIIMEGLHIALRDAMAANLFHGDQRDMENIIHVLHVFYMASGLKININKSNLFGVGVSSEEVVNMAATSGCLSSSLPLSYLGLPIGSNMNRVASWKVLIDRFKNKLPGWKASLLSIGGRLTLIKSVLGSLGIYYMSIFKAPEIVLKVLESFWASFFWRSTEDKKKLAWIKWVDIYFLLIKGPSWIGGIMLLIFTFYKWRWRLMKNPEALWVKVIKSIHGAEAGRSLTDYIRMLDVIGSVEVSQEAILVPGLFQMMVENLDHVFFSCETAYNVWRLICTWSSSKVPILSSYVDWNSWIDMWHASKDSKERALVIFAASCCRYVPCSKITMENINLELLQPRKEVTASCINVQGTEDGVNPGSCLKS